MASEKKAELLPCPFCGGNDLAIENQVVHPDNYHSAFVRCNDCEMDGPSSLSLPEPDGCWMPDAESAQEAAGKAWNRRAPAAKVPQTNKEPIETVKYWRDAYANPKGDEHFMGHGMVVKIIDDYIALLTSAPQPPDAAKDKTVDAVLQMLLEQKSKKDALIAKGICPTCEGKGECGGQFTGGEWTCEECNGTGKAHGIGKQDK